MKGNLLSRLAVISSNVLGICIPLLSVSTFAVANKPVLPNFDRRLDNVIAAPKALLSPQKKSAMDAISSKVKDAKIQTHRIVGGPSYIGSSEEFLTGKNGHGKA